MTCHSTHKPIAYDRYILIVSYTNLRECQAENKTVFDSSFCYNIVLFPERLMGSNFDFDQP